MTPLVVDATGNQLTYRIIGAAMKVHNDLGPGYKEEIYEKALWVQLNQEGIPTHRQFPVTVEHGGETIGLFFLDLLADDQVVIEIKAFHHLLTSDELAQVINYLQATAKPVGLLFNFGRPKLEYKRVFPSPTPKPPSRLGRNLVKPR